MSCHFLLQGIFLTQGSNPHLLNLLHCQADSLSPHHLGSPILKLGIIKGKTTDKSIGGGPEESKRECACMSIETLSKGRLVLSYPRALPYFPFTCTPSPHFVLFKPLYKGWPFSETIINLSSSGTYQCLFPALFVKSCIFRVAGNISWALYLSQAWSKYLTGTISQQISQWP